MAAFTITNMAHRKFNFLAFYLIVLDSTFASSNNNSDQSAQTSSIAIPVTITSCFFIAIALFGIVGNILVIYVLCRTPSHMVYETFCVGLAVTDLIFLCVSCPITIVQYIVRSWIFGLFWCKTLSTIVQVTVFSSSFVLLGLTTSRFLSVVFPWQNLKISELGAKIFCLGAWIAGMILALPISLYSTIEYAALQAAPPQTNSTSGNRTMDLFQPTSNSTMPMDNTVTKGVPICYVKYSDGYFKITYQLIVLLLTYVVPFCCIIVMNSAIICKLQRESAIDRHRRELEETKFDSNGCPTSGSDNAQEHRQLNENSCSSPTEILRCSINKKDFVPLSQADSVKARRREKQRRLRKRATKLVVLVTTFWCSCWLPTHILNSWFNFDAENFPVSDKMKIFKLIAHLLSYAASCVNPVVYGLMTGTFKSNFRNKWFTWIRQRR